MSDRLREPDVLGIPVWFDASFRGCAEARGILWWKKIVVGYAYMQLVLRERSAILLHEACHCHRSHMEKRALAMFPMLAWVTPPYLVSWALRMKKEPEYFLPAFFLNWIHAQELEADQFAAQRGYAHDLVRWLARSKAHEHWTYPDHAERIGRLMEARNDEKAA